MIEVGDLVRFKNEAIRRGGVLSRVCDDGRMFRGKQRIVKVLRVLKDRYDPETSWHTRIVQLDFPGRREEFMRVDVRWLTVFKKAANIPPPVVNNYVHEVNVNPYFSLPALWQRDREEQRASDLLLRYSQIRQPQQVIEDAAFFLAASPVPGDILENNGAIAEDQAP